LKEFRVWCLDCGEPCLVCLLPDLVKYGTTVTFEVLASDVLGHLLETIEKRVLAAPDRSLTADE